MIKAAIITLSDKGARGEREDLSGPAVKEMLEGIGAEVTAYEIIPDEKALIIEKLTLSWEVTMIAIRFFDTNSMREFRQPQP